MPETVTIIDYGLGNLFSVARAFRYLGCNAVITDKPEVVSRAVCLILPGVGSFAEGIANITNKGLVEPVQAFGLSGRPLLGICLGMQLLMNISEEFGVHRGLGIIKGKIVRLSESEESGMHYKIPHIGWNRIEESGEGSAWDGSILHGINSGAFVYFAHSYKVVPENPKNILAQTVYGSNNYCSSVKEGNVYGAQFHPEKSGTTGLKILKNFLDIAFNNL